VRPRIAVQSVGLQPYFWIIDRGAPVLEPGQRDVYRVRAGAPYEEFSVRHGARVIVSSADDLSLRGAFTVAGDVSDAYRDAIPNGRFRYLAASGERPAFWGLVSEPPGAGSVRALEPTGAGAPTDGVTLELSEAGDLDQAFAERRVVLDTFVVLPHEPLEVTVRVPAGANELPDLDAVYGLRVVVRRKEAWVLFGDEASSGDVGGAVRFAMVEAPRGEWSTHRIDLRKIVAELWTELSPSYERRTGTVTLGYPVVPANVQLMLMARAPLGKLAAEFGPVVATALRPSRQRVFAETRATPELMPLWRGDLAFTYGNFDKAREHYLTAMELAPAAPLPQLRLAETEFWIGEWEAALDAYQAAVNRDAKEPLAYKGAGWCHYNLERYPQAIAAWKSALRLFELEGGVADETHVADAHRGLAMAAWRQADCQAATRSAAAARALDPAVALPAELVADCGL
jgi:tetratricopeptide (TPR) repeat protein